MRKRLWFGLIIVTTLLYSTNTTAEQETVPQQKQIVTNIIKESDEKEIDTHSETAEEVNDMYVERISIEENVEEEDYIEIKCELTFYTYLPQCCGKGDGITASGKTVNSYTVAVPRKVNSTNPVFPFGTKIYIEGYGDKIVQDTGNPKYLKIKSDGTYILDVFIPRNSGESDNQYLTRVNNMGRVPSTAKVYIDKEW